MDTCLSNKRQLCGGGPGSVEKMLAFGRELQTLSITLKQEQGTNQHNKKLIQVLITCFLKLDIILGSDISAVC